MKLISKSSITSNTYVIKQGSTHYRYTEQIDSEDGKLLDSQVVFDSDGESCPNEEALLDSFADFIDSQ